MIGIIEKVLVDCLLEVGDNELRQDVFLAAGIPNDRIYRMDQHYPDSETARLIAATLEVTKLKTQELFDLFGHVFFDVVEDVFPEFLRMSENSEELVRRQAKIHALIAAGSRKPGESEKSTDKFQIEEIGQHEIVVRYKSEMQLCGLYETLVHHAARRYGDTVEFADHVCAHKGAEACVMRLRWTAIRGLPTHLFSGNSPDETVRAAHG